MAQTVSMRRTRNFEGVAAEELTEREAVLPSFKTANVEEMEREAKAEYAKRIVQVLGHLPLATAIAGSYIAQSLRLSLKLPLYLEEYKQQQLDLLQEQPQDIVENCSDGLMTVWETTYAAMNRQFPDACRILDVLGFLSNEGIDEDLFILRPSPGYTKTWASIIGIPENLTKPHFGKCLSTLERYSMIQRNASRTSYTMHKPVHT
ncbi:hypothetical protein B0J13DRAFT_518635 [Dactylonectria estremocensis]|uniref:Uncharacterized protein n=1 Tax=Dactylonectria estremocensis TaxID=1079267 RepID=A0A9P9JJ12_9HYPO|nr:hypothetical protein B0J13DRAFT_518635 [Dactylonectria estremocensis]